jgi:hypothetical protein
MSDNTSNPASTYESKLLSWSIKWSGHLFNLHFVLLLKRLAWE